MNDYLKNKLNAYNDTRSRYHYLREYLQLLILKVLDEKGHFKFIAFVGGTALRILYDLHRFSEDLDFALVNKKHYSLPKIAEDLEYELTKYNFPATVKYKDKNNVAVVYIKFGELLAAAGLSNLAAQKIFIKMEIDEFPPEGFQTELSVINKDFFAAINHYDLPSLFAGKLHAILCRKYTKGRDYYDLLWYLSHNTEPNFKLLNAAVLQTQGKNPHFDKESLKNALSKKITETDFKLVLNDVDPFLQDTNESRLFNQTVFLAALNKWKQTKYPT
ncbi:MAG: nucleotidyl transferase AbiEii/AbiGii toxin family protein [Gammaproteobacteria bacterium]